MTDGNTDEEGKKTERIENSNRKYCGHFVFSFFFVHLYVIIALVSHTTLLKQLHSHMVQCNKYTYRLLLFIFFLHISRVCFLLFTFFFSTIHYFQYKMYLLLTLSYSIDIILLSFYFIYFFCPVRLFTCIWNESIIIICSPHFIEEYEIEILKLQFNIAKKNKNNLIQILYQLPISNILITLSKSYYFFRSVYSQRFVVFRMKVCINFIH